MSRRSYREHRAQRAQARSDDGTDRDSIASFSTFASHTSFGSIGRSYPYSSFSAMDSGAATPYYGNTGLAPTPMSLRHRTLSNISRETRDSVSPAPASAGSTPTPSSVGVEGRERDKRRRRARNEEKWRRVRAREAAHDAPVRQIARAVSSKLGGKGVMVVTVVSCLALRIVLSAVVLSVNPCAGVAKDVAALLKLCADKRGVAPILRPFMPMVCGALGDGKSIRASVVILVFRVLLESLLWSAAVAWATLEGWREGRTMRTRVAAVVYLVMAPVLVLGDAAAIPVRAGLGFTAWALVATCSGHDGVASALLAAAVWAGRYAAVYIPAFAAYALGKRIWLGKRGGGYFARLIVSAAFAIAVLEALSPAPLRERARTLFAIARSPTVVLPAITFLSSVRAVLSIVALFPSIYLTLKASSALAPKSNEPATPNTVPATARLLPMALAATAGALAIFPADAALPLLPLALVSSLRRDDDEWAVAVQAHHVAAINLWSKIPPSLLPLAGAYTIGWSWLIGSKIDAPSIPLRIHQGITVGLSALAILGSMIPSHPYLAHAHTLFLFASVLALTIWANVRLVKTAWAVGAL